MEKNNFSFQNLKARIKNRMENYSGKWNNLWLEEKMISSEGFKDSQKNLGDV